ncbi:hypothetical protein GNQ08_20605 [Paenibacillus macerans]|uniref:Dit-like phage tail protein N-terminal domain-containing protein n=1 Tax=Paenibacillus macerans TaxID=44252 RepID=A0A6N8F1J0_PAEMA|nr:hypothetical protein [Paenibacillus macerans]MUG24773.1 hypothetical protein [Paenibacillus macerans]
MATIDGNYIWIEKEDPTFDVDITTQPVEKDIDMTDHVQRKARTMSLNGAVAGPDAARILTYLKKCSDTGQVVKYVGRMAFTGIISGLSTSHDYTIADGYSFSFTLTEVRVAQSSYVDKLPVPVKAQAAKIVNSGVKQTKSKKSTGSKKTAKSTDKKKVEKVKFKKGSPWAE